MDWAKLETALQGVNIRFLKLSDIQWENIETLLKNIGNQKFQLVLDSVQFDERTLSHFARVAVLCKDMRLEVTKLTLSKTAYCEEVELSFSTNMSKVYATPRTMVSVPVASSTIQMEHAYLGPEDMSRIQQLVSAFQSWVVESDLHLTEPGPDDWAILSQLADCLTILDSLEILSTPRLVSEETLSHMRNVWQKCSAENWLVNREEYSNDEEDNFEELVEKHFR